MPTMLKDGKGTSQLAGVTSNKLEVTSRSNERIYYASRDSDKAFIVQFEHAQQTDNTSETIGYIKYLGSDRLNIKQVTFSTEDTALSKFSIWSSQVVSGGEDQDIVNLKINSNVSMNVECKHTNDGTTPLTSTDGNSIFTYRMYEPSSKIIDFFDAIILEYNSVLTFRCAVSTAGSKVRVNVMMHESIE